MGFWLHTNQQVNFAILCQFKNPVHHCCFDSFFSLLSVNYFFISSFLWQLSLVSYVFLLFLLSTAPTKKLLNLFSSHSFFYQYEYFLVQHSVRKCILYLLFLFTSTRYYPFYQFTFFSIFFQTLWLYPFFWLQFAFHIR